MAQVVGEVEGEEAVLIEGVEGTEAALEVVLEEIEVVASGEVPEEEEAPAMELKLPIEEVLWRSKERGNPSELPN